MNVIIIRSWCQDSEKYSTHKEGATEYLSIVQQILFITYDFKFHKGFLLRIFLITGKVFVRPPRYLKK